MAQPDLKSKKHSLSFSYLRKGEESEFELMVTRFRESATQPLSPNKEITSSILLAIVAFILTAPISFLIAYLIRLFTGYPLISTDALIIAMLGFVILWNVYSLYKLKRKHKAYNQLLSNLEKDFQNGDVIEESWRFINAIAFHEPEEDKIFYALHADNNEVLCFSHNYLLQRDRKPNEVFSSAAPAEIIAIRAPLSHFLIKSFVTGPTLSVIAHYGTPIGKKLVPFEGENITQTRNIRWNEVVRYFASR